MGNASFGVAMQLGFEAVDFTAEPEAKDPAEPNFEAIVGSAGRQAIFGPLKFVGAPGGDFGKESIRITNDFEAGNVIRAGQGNPILAQIQKLLGVKADGFWGPVSQQALNDELDGDGSATIVSGGTGFKAEASSFADPADVKAFETCKATGKTDQACFKVGDNGIGQLGKIQRRPTR